VQQGINLNNVTAQGLGKSNPVASNATTTGRQQNRRVELVVNGEPIDVNAGVNPAPGTQPSSAPAATGTEAAAPAATNTDAASSNAGLPQSDQGAQSKQAQPASGTQPNAAPVQTPGTTIPPANTQQPNTAPTVPK